ncbi:hypothetical protein ACVWW7_003385 [Bradyrhizobium sp. LM6.9]
MTPLRDAMRLVDREQRHLRPRQQRQATRRHQPFRRDIEQVEIARDQAPLDVGGFLRGQRRVQRGGVDPGFEHAGDLVAHQRNQGRHHDTAAFAQQRRQLIAQRLAAAGRHQHQAIAAVRDVPDDLALRAAEPGQAEHRMQHRQRIAALGRRRQRSGGGRGHGRDETLRFRSTPVACRWGHDKTIRAASGLRPLSTRGEGRRSYAPILRSASATVTIGMSRFPAACNAWRIRCGVQPYGLGALATS